MYVYVIDVYLNLTEIRYAETVVKRTNEFQTMSIWIEVEGEGLKDKRVNAKSLVGLLVLMSPDVKKVRLIVEGDKENVEYLKKVGDELAKLIEAWP